MSQESTELKELIIEGIHERKGHNVTIVDMSAIESVATPLFIIAEGNSTTQTSAIADAVEEYVRKASGIKPYNVDGANHGDWVIMDYGDIWVHVFIPQVRQRYNLEELWSDAAISQIPDL